MLHVNCLALGANSKSKLIFHFTELYHSLVGSCVYCYLENAWHRHVLANDEHLQNAFCRPEIVEISDLLLKAISQHLRFRQGFQCLSSS